MTGASYLSTIDRPAEPDPRLGPHELAVLKVLTDNIGRVVGRLELARRADLSDLGERRSDSLLVTIRRALDPDSIRTVRGRGWMLVESARDRALELLAPTAHTAETLRRRARNTSPLPSPSESPVLPPLPPGSPDHP